LWGYRSLGMSTPVTFDLSIYKHAVYNTLIVYNAFEVALKWFKRCSSINFVSHIEYRRFGSIEGSS